MKDPCDHPGQAQPHQQDETPAYLVSSYLGSSYLGSCNHQIASCQGFREQLLLYKGYWDLFGCQSPAFLQFLCFKRKDFLEKVELEFQAHTT